MGCQGEREDHQGVHGQGGQLGQGAEGREEGWNL